MADKEPSLAVGQRLGKYLLTEKLGEGGMGVVFGGIHEQLGREVAVKVLRGEFASNENVVLRFQQEAEAVSRIGHANIVAVYDFGRLEDGSLYYVMERIRGLTLSQRMHAADPLGPEETVSIFGQICRALHATHSRGIVHRDLKPDNVLLQPTQSASGMPHVKLVDFGVAKMRQLAQDEANPSNPNLTKSGMLLGTPTYMAPEQITSSGTVDGRADLYSLGAMLYEVLTGQPPFGRGELLIILTKHVKEAVVPPSQKVPDRKIPPTLDAFVLKSLAKKAKDRQVDANAFIAELETAWGIERPRTPSMLSIAPKVVDNSALTEAPPASRRWLLPAVVGGVLLVGGGVGGLVLANRNSSTVVRKPIKVAAESPVHTEANRILAAALAGDALGRRAAVEAMAEVGDRGAMDQVITALGDDNPEIRRAAANAAIAIGKPEDTALKTALAEAGARSGGAVAVDLAAARYLLGDATAQEDLERALEMRDPAARLRAAVALARGPGQGRPGKLPAGLLRQAIAAAPPTVRRSLRWAAFVQLQQLGDPAFSAELKAALDGKDPVAKLDAAQTLARAHDSAGMVALATLAAEAPDPVDRVDAAAVQAELGDVGALDALALALTSPSQNVRARAATSLGRLAASLPDQATLEKQLSPLLKDADAGPRVAAAAALLAVKITAPATTPTAKTR